MILRILRQLGISDYYPLGLQIPDRVFVSGSQTREGYTDYELDDETGDYYAGARYYLPELGRFLSTDRFQEKYPSLSPYQYAANNSVSLIDVNGDSLYVDGNTKTAFSHLQGLVGPEHTKRLTMGENGLVSFNTMGLDVSSDAGLQLVSDLVSSDRSFLFEIVKIAEGVLRLSNDKGNAGDVRATPIEETGGVENYSISNRNIDGGTGSVGLRPRNGFDGQVSLGSGAWTDTATGRIQPITNIVFHELAESYHRTVNREPWGRPDGTGAHQRAILDASRFRFQVGTPGQAGRYLHK